MHAGAGHAAAAVGVGVGRGQRACAAGRGVQRHVRCLLGPCPPHVSPLPATLPCRPPGHLGAATAVLFYDAALEAEHLAARRRAAHVERAQRARAAACREAVPAAGGGGDGASGFGGDGAPAQGGRCAHARCMARQTVGGRFASARSVRICSWDEVAAAVTSSCIACRVAGAAQSPWRTMRRSRRGGERAAHSASWPQHRSTARPAGRTTVHQEVTLRPRTHQKADA